MTTVDRLRQNGQYFSFFGVSQRLNFKDSVCVTYLLSEMGEQMNQSQFKQAREIHSTKQAEMKLDVTCAAKCQPLPVLEMSNSVREQKSGKNGV